MGLEDREESQSVLCLPWQGTGMTMALVHLRGSITLLPEVQGQKALWFSCFIQQGLPVFVFVILEGENVKPTEM